VTIRGESLFPTIKALAGLFPQLPGGDHFPEQPGRLERWTCPSCGFVLDIKIEAGGAQLED